MNPKDKDNADDKAADDDADDQEEESDDEVDVDLDDKDNNDSSGGNIGSFFPKLRKLLDDEVERRV